MLPRSSVLAVNTCLANAGSVTTTMPAEHRHLDGEGFAVFRGQPGDRLPAKERVADALQQAWAPAATAVTAGAGVPVRSETARSMVASLIGKTSWPLAWYCAVPRRGVHGTVQYHGDARGERRAAVETAEIIETTAPAGSAGSPGDGPFRERLLDGLAAVDHRARLPRDHGRRHRPARQDLQAHLLRPVRQQGRLPAGTARHRQRPDDRRHPRRGGSRSRLAHAGRAGHQRLHHRDRGRTRRYRSPGSGSSRRWVTPPVRSSAAAWTGSPTC